MESKAYTLRNLADRLFLIGHLDLAMRMHVSRRNVQVGCFYQVVRFYGVNKSKAHPSPSLFRAPARIGVSRYARQTGLGFTSSAFLVFVRRCAITLRPRPAAV